jgi:sulfur oxygenase/reductase
MSQDNYKGVAIAVNQAKVINEAETFEKMSVIGPKVCMTTANHPGFLGFHALLQVGAHPLGGRYGGARIVNAESLEKVMESPTNINLNPLNLWQYTMWNDMDDHEQMHHENFSRIFELCGSCLSFVLEGPDEPMFTVVDADMPPLIGMTDVPNVLGAAFAAQQEVPKVRLDHRRVVAIGEHKVRADREEQFLEGALATLKLLKDNAPGMIGWMVMKKHGESGIGPMQFTPPYLWEGIQTLGANPPSKPITNYGEWGKDYRSFATPHTGDPEYFVHMEWETPTALSFGLALTAVNPKVRKIHDEGVLTTLAKLPPYYRVMLPLMEDMVFFH